MAHGRAGGGNPGGLGGGNPSNPSGLPIPLFSGAGSAKVDATMKAEKNRASTCCMTARFLTNDSV